ncbi:MAG: mismatch-specific DNA-glycosylase [Solirubrobacterales bacterium]|nr:mismatch-specific DNA-glycosylase [Solirubrobacterales bacterium]
MRRYGSPVEDALPDLLAPGLPLVFCGSAAGTASARAGAYYAGPGNVFWEALYEAGLCPELLAPDEYRRLPEFGIGLTDLCKVSHGSDAEVAAEYDVDRLRAAIAEAEPMRLAFNGKNAAQAVLEMAVGYGVQEETVGGAEVWVLPSTSGRARRFWKIEPWRRLAEALAGDSSPG